MKDQGVPRVLFAPLNWGIGHATRSIPLITFLLEQGAEVELAASGQAHEVLAEQFPQLKLHVAPPFEVHYGAGRTSTAWRLFRSGLGLLKQVQREQAWLKDRFPPAYFQGVVSDNAYGMYVPGAQNVLITHQLALHSGMGSWIDTQLGRRTAKLLRPFQEIWIPDFEKEPECLAGKLSHPDPKPVQPIVYLGPLSRLTPITNANPQTILFLISGPEPQRTYFERIAHEVAGTLSTEVTIVGGNMGADKKEGSEHENASGHRVFLAYANQNKLSALLSSADLVVARSGYSSVMDIVQFGKKAVWVPTPGQGEQEYLASYLAKKYAHFLQAQQNVESIRKAIEMLGPIVSPSPIHSKQFEGPLRNWYSKLNGRN